MMTYWFSHDPETGAGIGRGVSAVPLSRVAENDPNRGFIEITPAQYQSIDRADRFFVDSSGALQRKTKLTLAASAGLAPADGKSAITISWTPAVAEALNVIVNMRSQGAHAESIEMSSAAPGRFRVHVMDALYYSDRLTVAFE